MGSEGIEVPQEEPWALTAASAGQVWGEVRGRGESSGGVGRTGLLGGKDIGQLSLRRIGTLRAQTNVVFQLGSARVCNSSVI